MDPLLHRVVGCPIAVQISLGFELARSARDLNPAIAEVLRLRKLGSWPGSLNRQHDARFLILSQYFADGPHSH